MISQLMTEIEQRLSAEANRTFQDILNVYRVSPERVEKLRQELTVIGRADRVTFGGEVPCINASMQACELINMLLGGLQNEYQGDEPPLRIAE